MLTIDEARDEVVRSAVRCLRYGSCPPEGLLAMVWALPGGARWSSADHELVADHRRVFEQVCAAGHGWVITEEIEGIIAATGLGDGEVHDVDVFLAELDADDEADEA